MLILLSYFKFKFQTIWACVLLPWYITSSWLKNTQICLICEQTFTNLGCLKELKTTIGVISRQRGTFYLFIYFFIRLKLELPIQFPTANDKKKYAHLRKFCETRWLWPPLFLPNCLIQWSMGEGFYITLFSRSDITEFHRMKYGGGGHR